ncbi:MAG TPA: M1 family aminopeptidase [Terriglobales bacterium]|nr:M1 family aminopeptidase [Terriglobales bacterium]
MFTARRPLRRALVSGLFAFLFCLPLFAAEKPRIEVNDYQIDAELVPRTHRLVARAVVKFTALDDIAVAVFELHNGLRPTKVTDPSGTSLSVERVSQDSTVRIALPNGLAKGASTTLTFNYEGSMESPDDSPVQGLRLASINDDTTYLLYAARWFPVSGYGINRFTATMNITVPNYWVVIGSGAQGSRAGAGAPLEAASATDEPVAEGTRDEAPALRKRSINTPRARTARVTKAEPKHALTGDTKTYTFSWQKPGFPGTIIAGQFQESDSTPGGMNLHVFYKPIHKNLVGTYADTASREFSFFTTLWGPPMSPTLNVIEIPDDTVPSAWSAEVVALSSRSLSGKINYRLMADAIAHQWWGNSVSPASKNDWWIPAGFSRYAEAAYVEHAAGPAAYEEVVKDIDVGALAYDTTPLASVGKLDMFSPEFQSLTTDKGAAILSMLRWVMGDEKFDKTMMQFASQYAGKSATVDDFRTIAEKNYGDNMTWFFTQWLNSTGAPEFKTKYTVYRLGNTCNDPTKCKGFRIVGEISQDLDLFRMPVQIKVDTDGRSETQTVDVVGTNSAFTIETFGRPRKISIDPNNDVLKNSPEIRLRAAIQRGQGLVQQNDLAGALQEFQKALDVNKNSSLAHYRIAEVFFLQKNYQAAANAYRESLNGDGEPKWTEVWSHLQLGKIFDITGQRERAANEYRQAIQTQDDTQGALEEARKYLQAPYNPQSVNNGTNGD